MSTKNKKNIENLLHEAILASTNGDLTASEALYLLDVLGQLEDILTNLSL
jgi:hypothetical protein